MYNSERFVDITCESTISMFTAEPYSRHRLVHRKSARRAIISIIETFAVENDLSFIAASRLVVRDPQWFTVVLDACGNRFTGRMPSDRTVRSWRDPERQHLAYMSPAKRQPVRQAQPPRSEQASRLSASGMARTAIAKKLGAALSSVYRWVPVAVVGHEPTIHR